MPDDVLVAAIGSQALDIFFLSSSRVCAQEWHRKDIRSHIHSHPPIHTPKTNRAKPSTTNHDAFVHLSPSSPMWWWATARKLGRCSSDIFLHGPKPAQKNSIVKTSNHSHIHSHPPSTHQTCGLLFVVLFSSNVEVGDFQEAWQMLLGTAPRRRPSDLGQY